MWCVPREFISRIKIYIILNYSFSGKRQTIKAQEKINDVLIE